MLQILREKNGSWVEHQEQEWNVCQRRYPGFCQVDGQTCDLQGVQSLGAVAAGGRRDCRGRGSGLYDLPAVANGTAQHHAEDHPDDLPEGRRIFNQCQWINETLLAKKVSYVCVCVFFF